MLGSDVSKPVRFSKPIRLICNRGFSWWKWSVLFVLIIGGLEFLVLIGCAIFGYIEFAVMASYFLAFATAIALPATALLIFVWLLLTLAIPIFDSKRWWVVVYILILFWPLYFGPISMYEVSLAAPTILGFALPRFFISKLTKVWLP